MPVDFTYFRKYIILRNDYKNIDNIEPKGHGKIEIRGNKGTIKINLENCEKDEQYRIYLLKEHKGLVDELDLGRILTDENGRGRIEIDLRPKELQLRGFPLEKLEAIVIRRDENILLSGYIDKSSKIVDKYIRTIVERHKEEVKNENIKEEILPEEVEYKEYDETYTEEKNSKDLDNKLEYEELSEEPEIKPATRNPEEKPKEEESKEVENQFDKEPEVEKVEEVEEKLEKEEVKEEELKKDMETKEIEEKPVEKIEDKEVSKEPKDEGENEQSTEKIQEGFYNVTNRPYQHYKSIEYMRNLNNKNQMTNYILSVLKFFPQVQPFKVYLHGYTWWRIDDDGSNFYRGFLPYYNYLLSADYKYPFIHNATTCINQIIKYGHYLFGLYKEGNDVKYYVYGVPGRFAIKEHPFKGITGFNTWYESIDNIGYWILYIDPMTGKIIYPINPMVPTE